MPLWPSLMAVVERAEREVVVEVGVPLSESQGVISRGGRGKGDTYGISGVSGLEGPGGRLMRVGWEVCDIFADGVCGCWR